jgi:ppGpp synthetase/RelA/SpoT-type nucleotidyltranferase
VQQEDVEQVMTEYHQKRDRLSGFAEKLKEEIKGILEEGGLKLADIHCRVKDADRLRSKVQRKAKYRRLIEVTDVVGVRVVTYYLADAIEAARIIRGCHGGLFVIDWPNSENKSDKLRVEEFGYRSDHYVLGLGPAYHHLPKAKEYEGMKAEVQVRSILQHAWAEIEHDELGYHNRNAVPREVRRGLARVAGLLEVADREFQDIRELASKISSAELPKLRAEGLAESIDDFEIGVPSDQVVAGMGDIVVFFNTNLTQRIGPEQSMYLVVDDGVESKPNRGKITSANAVTFIGALPSYVRKDLRHVRFKLSGIRVNANQRGYSDDQGKPTLVTCSLAARTTSDNAPKVFAFQEIASIAKGLVVECEVMDQRSPLNPGVASETARAHQVKNLGGVLSVRVKEGFPGAFRDRVTESGRDRIQCNHGTRIAIQFWGLGSHHQIWVGMTNTGHSGSKLRLVETDSNGANAFKSALGRGDTLVLRNEENVSLFRVPIFNGAGMAVWEVELSGKSDQPACLDLVVVPASSTDVGTSFDNVGLSVNLAPLSTVGTGSDTAPIPRFVPGEAPFRPWRVG